jgi:hypothetical protein
MNDPMDVEMADAEITVTPPLTSHRTALQEIGQCNIFNHKCTRHCNFKHLFGNLFRCDASGKNHVCDKNCTDTIFYDNYNRICRLSKKLFPADPSTVPVPLARKRREQTLELECSKRMCR